MYKEHVEKVNTPTTRLHPTPNPTPAAPAACRARAPPPPQPGFLKTTPAPNFRSLASRRVSVTREGQPAPPRSLAPIHNKTPPTPNPPHLQPGFPTLRLPLRSSARLSDLSRPSTRRLRTGRSAGSNQPTRPPAGSSRPCRARLPSQVCYTMIYYYTNTILLYYFTYLQKSRLSNCTKLPPAAGLELWGG